MATLQQLKNVSNNDPRLQAFIGKTAIVGEYEFYKGEPKTRWQGFGEIIGFKDGIMVFQTQGGKLYFPIIYDALIPAPRGQYTLYATGEKVVNPDYLVSWRLDLADNIEESEWQADTAPHFASIVGKDWDFEYAYDENYLKELIESRRGDYLGKTVLAGLSKYAMQDNGDRKLVEQTQIYGEVVRLSFTEGIVIRLKDGSECKLPPDVSMLQTPPPGEYVLHSTQEVIINPDLMTIWDLN